MEPGPPEERPQRRREYSGPGSTLGLAALIVVVVGLAVWWFEVRDGGSSADRGEEGLGIVALEPGRNPTSQDPAARDGRAAPDFRLRTLDGAVARLSDYRGRFVLVNFWASWCSPCRGETPELQRLQEEHPGRLTVLGVNIQEDEGAARGFVDDFDLTYPILLDRTGEVTRAYRGRTPPVSYLVSPDGVVVKTFIGRMTSEQIAALAEEYLG